MIESLEQSALPETAPAAVQSKIQNPKSEIETIHILAPAVTSRIAAGEVVERPASVIKELAENALDAGATKIHVDISAGGRQLIRVSDNGRGMNRADLALCVLPHATSKLSSADELSALTTLGFRGEALPSIAAVSKFTLTSRPNRSAAPTSDGGAWRIEILGGEPGRPQPHPAAGAPGCTVEVKELFYNLPAREKFLKGAASEAAACADTLLRLALTRPDVAFTLRQDRHAIFDLPAEKSPESKVQRPESRVQSAGSGFTQPYFRRAREVLGRDASRGLLELAVEGPGEEVRESESPGVSGSSASSTPRLPDSYRGYRLYGLISPPAASRSNRSSIYLTVNGRAVKDRLLTSAVLESYRHLLPPKRFPAAVLFLELPGGDVDINVHPTKAEVRFRLPGLVYALFHHAVRSACGVKESTESPMPDTQAHSGPGSFSKPPIGANRIEPGQKAFDLWPGLMTGRSEQAEGSQRHATPSSIVQEAAAPYSRPPVAEPTPDPIRQWAQTPIQNPHSKIQNSQPFRVLAQAGGSYIVLEDDTGVKLIDQHALHERVLFDELLARAEGRSRGDSQGLLIAETLELSPAQTAVFTQDQNAAAVLKEIGFDVELFGPRTIAVRAVPAILPASAALYVRDILDALASDDPSPGAKKPAGRAHYREKAAYVLSCKGAVKAGERLTLEQMTALIVEFKKSVGGGAFTCPHGRPLAVELSWEDLERGVGRR